MSPAAPATIASIDNVPPRPAMNDRLRRAGVWMIPFVVLVILRKLFSVPDELLAMPANGIAPTQFEEFINLATAGSLWFGLLAFLARLVWDDSPGLSAILIGIIIFAVPPAGLFVLYVLFS